MKSIKVSAPGKLMILGEHAVVYGHPCIVTAVDKRLYVTVEIKDSPGDVFETPQVKECKFLQEAVGFFKQKFAINQSVRIQTQGDFSHQVGLGSSSAVTVAVLKALSQLFGIKLSDKEIFDFGYQTTIKIQGVGSGFDIAAATFGGTLYYIFGGKKIEQINIENLPLIVGYSGVKADTPAIVKNLKSKVQDPKLRIKIQNIFSQISGLVDKGRSAIEKKNWRLLGNLMVENQKLLQELGVSTDKLDKMCQAALGAGAWGAKLSGAGGGDCMIALSPAEKRQSIEQAIKDAGGELIDVANCADGVRLEHKGDKVVEFEVETNVTAIAN